MTTQKTGLTNGERNGANDRLATFLGWFSVGLGLAEVFAPGQVAKLIGLHENGDKRRPLLRFYGTRELAAGIGILSQEDPTGWLWGRVAGDALDLASLGSAFIAGDANRLKLVAATAAVAGVTALDIVCAQRSAASDESSQPTRRRRVAREMITISRAPDEVYQFWRNIENLPRFMDRLESVEGNEERSHWKVKGPAGMTIEWDAETVDDQPNSRIAWRTLGGSDVDHSGSVSFSTAPGGRGTVVTVEIEFKGVAHTLGAAAAKLFGAVPAYQIKENLRALKQVMETGEVVYSDASIHSGMHPAQPSNAEQIYASSARA